MFPHRTRVKTDVTVKRSRDFWAPRSLILSMGLLGMWSKNQGFQEGAANWWIHQAPWNSARRCESCHPSDNRRWGSFLNTEGMCLPYLWPWITWGWLTRGLEDLNSHAQLQEPTEKKPVQRSGYYCQGKPCLHLPRCFVSLGKWSGYFYFFLGKSWWGQTSFLGRTSPEPAVPGCNTQPAFPLTRDFAASVLRRCPDVIQSQTFPPVKSCNWAGDQVWRKQGSWYYTEERGNTQLLKGWTENHLSK